MGYIGNAPYQGVLTGGNIQDGTVETIDLADEAVTTTKLHDQAVTAGKLHTTLDLSDKTLNLPAAAVTAHAPVSSVNGQTGAVTVDTSIDSNDVTTALGYTPVNKSGDTMSSDLTISGANKRITVTDGTKGMAIGQWDGANNRVEVSGANTLFAQYGIYQVAITNQTTGAAFVFGSDGQVTTSNSLYVNGGKLWVNTQSSGATAASMQCITGSTSAASSGSYKKIVHVGESHSLRVNILAISGNDVASLSAVMNTCYGSSVVTVIATHGHGGLSSPGIQYDNGGSPNYSLDFRVTYSTSTPTIYWNVEGVSRASMYNV
jgi:hypothetical protein